MRTRWTQTGFVPIIVTLLVLALEVSLIAGYHINQLTNWVVIGLAFVVLFAGSSMTIEVTHDAIRWWFTGGLLRQTVTLDNITALSVLDTPVVAGFGIRMSSEGTLWAVGGSRILEISRASGKTVLLGTSNATEICTKLQAVMKGADS